MINPLSVPVALVACASEMGPTPRLYDAVDSAPSTGRSRIDDPNLIRRALRRARTRKVDSPIRVLFDKLDSSMIEPSGVRVGT